jgi:hypothetical protein
MDVSAFRNRIRTYWTVAAVMARQCTDYRLINWVKGGAMSFAFRTAIGLCALAYPMIATAQRMVIPRQQLAASSDSVRIEAFSGLMKQALRLQAGPAKGVRSVATPTVALAAEAERSPELRSALVDLLNRENARLSVTPMLTSGESFSEYYVNVATTVARMQDPTVFRSLLPAIDNGDVMTSGIAAGGEQAVPDVLTILRDRSVSTRRYGAAITLGKIARGAGGPGVSAGALRTIRDGLLDAAHDSTDYVVRIVAIRALDSFDDPELRAAMARIASADSATSPRGATRIYPVRKAAQQWLDSRAKR